MEKMMLTQTGSISADRQPQTVFQTLESAIPEVEHFLESESLFYEYRNKELVVHIDECHKAECSFPVVDLKQESIEDILPDMLKFVDRSVLLYMMQSTQSKELPSITPDSLFSAVDNHSHLLLSCSVWNDFVASDSINDYYAEMGNCAEVMRGRLGKLVKETKEIQLLTDIYAEPNAKFTKEGSAYALNMSKLVLRYKVVAEDNMLKVTLYMYGGVAQELRAKYKPKRILQAADQKSLVREVIAAFNEVKATEGGEVNNIALTGNKEEKERLFKTLKGVGTEMERLQLNADGSLSVEQNIIFETLESAIPGIAKTLERESLFYEYRNKAEVDMSLCSKREFTFTVISLQQEAIEAIMPSAIKFMDQYILSSITPLTAVVNKFSPKEILPHLERCSHLLVNFYVFNDIVADSSWTAFFSEIAKHESVINGRLGSLADTTLLTDGYRIILGQFTETSTAYAMNLKDLFVKYELKAVGNTELKLTVWTSGGSCEKIQQRTSKTHKEKSSFIAPAIDSGFTRPFVQPGVYVKTNTSNGIPEIQITFDPNALEGRSQDILQQDLRATMQKYLDEGGDCCWQEDENGNWVPAKPCGLVCEQEGCEATVTEENQYERLNKNIPNGWGKEPEFLCAEHSKGRTKIELDYACEIVGCHNRVSDSERYVWIVDGVAQKDSAFLCKEHAKGKQLSEEPAKNCEYSASEQAEERELSHKLTKHTNSIEEKVFVFHTDKSGELVKITDEGFYVRGKKLEQDSQEALKLFNAMLEYFTEINNRPRG